MKKITQEIPVNTDPKHWAILEQIVREGVRRILQLALDNEVDEYIEKYIHLRNKNGKRIVLKNGFLPARTLVTGIGPIQIKQCRIDDRHLSEYSDIEERYRSKIFPRYLRKMPSVDNSIPVLYMKGIATNDFSSVLSAILGEGEQGLSPANAASLKKYCEDEYKKWATRILNDKKYVYFRIDGIYYNVLSEDEQSCILYIMGADKDGNKELIAVQEGFGDSKTAWTEMLFDLKNRGLSIAPNLDVGDGALGFRAALDEVFPKAKL